MTLQALLWDVDGTIVDSEELHRQAFNLAFAQAGLPWRWDREEYGRLLGVAGGRERIRHFLATGGGAEAGSGRAGLDVAGLHRRKTALYAGLLESGAAGLRPGVARLMREAEACGLRQAIVTTTSLPNVRTLLDTLLCGVVRSWDALFTGESVLAKKPAPDIYVLALEQLGLRASDCLALEDSGLGLCAARLAGVPTLVTRSQYTGGDDFCGALAIFDHLGEPGLPCRRLFGPPFNAACVDLGHLRTWHGQPRTGAGQ
ncbi:MAG: HAD-IA family hydrolase [Proteobacteria bacterium]|nr:HAD-IA family hydrolase [Pseudomonadota bacterium]